MSINNKRGSVLILILAVISLLLVLGTSIMLVNTSTHKVQITNDTVSRINYMAESGIEVGLTVFRNNKNNINIEDLNSQINNERNKLVFQNGTIKLSRLEISSNKKDNNNNSIFNLISIATNGKISKTIIATLTKNEDSNNTDNLGDSPLTNNCLNVYGNINNSYNDFSVGNGNNTNLNINGSAYIQSYLSNFASNLNITNGNLIVLNKSKINFNNNSSNASISGKVFLQSDDDITLSQNITAGTAESLSGCTILSDKTINFDNNSTTSNIYGDAYVKGDNGVTMSQTLNVNKGDLKVISNNGDIILSGNSKPTTVSGWAFLLGNNITIARNTTIGTEANPTGFKVKATKYINFDKNSTTTTVFGDAYVNGITGITLGQNINVNKNLTAITNGGIDMGNTNKSITGNSYIKSNYVNGNIDATSKAGIYNASPMTVGGYSVLFSDNTITNDNGSKDNINGNLYVQSEKDLSMSNQINKVAGLYYVTSNNGNINFKNDIGNVSGGIYVKAKGDINLESSVNNINTNNDFTMISNSINMPWGKYYLRGDTFLKAPTKFHIDSKDNNLGNAYIETNRFEYRLVNALSLSGIINNAINVENNKNGVPNNFIQLPSPKSEPTKPDIPSEPSELQLPSKSTPNKVSIPDLSTTVKNNVTYNQWNNSYSGIQSKIVKGSNINDVVNAINASQDSNYKVIIIDGNCTLDNSAWSKINSVNGNININNTIIYCTGKLIIDNPGKIINFNHSTVFSNGFNFNYNTINMTAINKPGGTVTFTEDILDNIDMFLKDNLDNYHQSVKESPVKGITGVDNLENNDNISYEISYKYN